MDKSYIDASYTHASYIYVCIHTAEVNLNVYISFSHVECRKIANREKGSMLTSVLNLCSIIYATH